MQMSTNSEIDDLIDRSGLKINYIADKMGVSRQRLYDMRVNPLSMNIEQMESFSKVLGISFNDVYEARKKFRIKVDKNTTN
ncbi:helix-turn-helix domain-containing protein [Eremococcus coleocola]|uniref:helix-turn-helix domain-containing protein n=1 Tax=Eremococcus coleocola TaxID=88132 RepID=UPI000481D57C|nr:helix-turn-helix transcriptional regulator [Eremococcus coleocola]